MQVVTEAAARRRFHANLDPATDGSAMWVRESDDQSGGCELGW